MLMISTSAPGGRRSKSGLTNVRFAAKIVLGFAVILSLSAVGMITDYLGIVRITDSATAYRQSVLESDAARSVDRELLRFQFLTRYYFISGSEDDARAALTSRTILKAAINDAS